MLPLLDRKSGCFCLYCRVWLHLWHWPRRLGATEGAKQCCLLRPSVTCNCSCAFVTSTYDTSYLMSMPRHFSSGRANNTALWGLSLAALPPWSHSFWSCSVLVYRYSEQHVASALFALLHQQILFCKETAEWRLDDWDLTSIKASLETAGIACNSDCLSCVEIPL